MSLLGCSADDDLPTVCDTYIVQGVPYRINSSFITTVDKEEFERIATPEQARFLELDSDCQ